MNYTPNYQLSQWAASDRVQRTDFNADNTKIDAALAALQALADTKGNCRAQFGFYTGDGDKKRTMSIETDFPPQAILVVGYNSIGFFTRGADRTYITKSNYCYQIALTWTDTGVSWTGVAAQDGSYLMNDSSTTYCYAVFG